MLDIKYTWQFKKDAKKKRRQGLDLGKLDEVILALREQKPFPESECEPRGVVTA